MWDLGLLWGPGLCGCNALIHLGLSQLFTRLLAAYFPNLPNIEVKYAANWVVSLLQATAVTALGFVICWHSDFTLMDTRLPLLIPIGWAILGYWIYDLLALFHLANIERGNNNKPTSRLSLLDLSSRISVFVRWWPGIVIHHLGILLFITLGILGPTRGEGQGDGLIATSFLMELSSIFVSARSALARLQLKATRIYLIVSVAMVVTFFAVRMVLVPGVIVLYGLQTGGGVTQAFLAIPLKCQVGTAAFYCLNLYWFMLMIRGCANAYNKSKLP